MLLFCAAVNPCVHFGRTAQASSTLLPPSLSVKLKKKKIPLSVSQLNVKAPPSPAAPFSRAPLFTENLVPIVVRWFSDQMANNPQYPGLQPLRPPIAGSGDPQRNFAPPMHHVQYRHVVPTQQSQQFIPMPSQHYPPAGRGVPMMNVGMPPQNQQPQFPQPIQQLPPRHSQQIPLPSQAIPLPIAQPNMHISAEPMMAQTGSQAPNGYTPGLAGPGVPLSSSYTFAPSSYGQVQTNFVSTGQYQPVPQIRAPSGSSSQSIISGTTIPSNGEQPSVTTAMPTVTTAMPTVTTAMPTVTTAMPSATSALPPPAKNGSSDWIEHAAATGRRFYYNKKTKLSTWEKPYELMTPIEAATINLDFYVLL
ncbi:hypothetical protein RIF29_22761 [Crotalaria pallida]|uniref:WW domain-containing protein n=1 Tax=Crotalaria pallida TaxID=3830 RepID=A0AAN9F9A1_CROPI